MNTAERVQHLESVCRVLGVPFSRSILKQWIKDKQHPDRVRIERAAGKVFEGIDPPWTWSDWASSQQSPIRGIVAVTSLSPLSKHLERQPRCLDSWKRFGLTIASVNTSAEVESIQGLYPQVDHWIVEDDQPTLFTRKTQYVHRLVRAAVDLDARPLLINSDIEIFGDQKLLTSIPEDVAMVGIRHNYSDTPKSSMREGYGLDAFLLPYRFAQSIPETCYAIGKPFWDYWLPWLMDREGVTQQWIGSPLFYHQSHPLHWNEADWLLGREWFESEYRVFVSWEEWRRSKPYPPYVWTGDA